MTAELVTLGESMVVFVPETTGPLRHAERFSRGVAGAESNVAIGLSRLGHPTAWLGRLGDDEFGRHIVSTLRGEGVDLSYAGLDPGAPTGIMFKERAAGTDSRVFYYRRGSAASRQDAADIAAAAFRGARWLHLTGITPALGQAPRRAVARALQLARENGLGVSLDPNYRSRLWSAAEAGPILRELADHVDVVLMSDGEGQLLYGDSDPDVVASAALASGRRLVAVKQGDQGALIATADGRWMIPPFPVRVVEPTGAGDAFAAGLLAGVLEGRPPEICGRMGALCGALVCTVAGDWEGAPEAAQLHRLLAGAAEQRR